MPWCPQCRTEYEARVTTCVDCDAALVDSLPEESPGKPAVVVARAGTAHEASIMVATLKAVGIPAYTGAPDPYLPQYGNPVVGVSSEFLVWVPADAEDQALATLAGPQVTEDELFLAQQAADPEPEVDEPVEPAA